MLTFTLPSPSFVFVVCALLWHFYADFILASSTATATAACQRNLLKIYLSAQLLQRCHPSHCVASPLPQLTRALFVCAVMQLITHTRRTLHAHLHVVYPPKKKKERYMKLFTLPAARCPLSRSLALLWVAQRGIYNAFLMVLKMFPLRFALQLCQQRLN